MTFAINVSAFVGDNVSSLKTVPVSYLPDVSQPLLRGYGLRLLNRIYTGPLFRLRRSSDSAEQDFDSIRAALAWASGASANIVSLYDQSGNGKTVSAPASANEPLVISSGVVQAIGTLGRPKAVFDGATKYLICTGGQGLYDAGAMSMFGVVSGGATGVTLTLAAEASTSSANPVYAPAVFYSDTLTQQITNNSGVNPILSTTSSEPPAALTGSGKQITVIDTGSVWKKRVGGTSLADIAYTRSGTFTATHLAIGARVRTSIAGYFLGGMSELAFYGAALSDTDRNLIEANQTAYYGLS